MGAGFEHNFRMIMGNRERSQDADNRHEDHKFDHFKTFVLSHLGKHVLLLVGYRVNGLVIPIGSFTVT